MTPTLKFKLDNEYHDVVYHGKPLTMVSDHYGKYTIERFNDYDNNEKSICNVMFSTCVVSHLFKH